MSESTYTTKHPNDSQTNYQVGHNINPTSHENHITLGGSSNNIGRNQNIPITNKVQAGLKGSKSYVQYPNQVDRILENAYHNQKQDQTYMNHL